MTKHQYKQYRASNGFVVRATLYKIERLSSKFLMTDDDIKRYRKAQEDLYQLCAMFYDFKWTSYDRARLRAFIDIWSE